MFNPLDPNTWSDADWDAALAFEREPAYLSGEDLLMHDALWQDAA